MSGPVPAVLRFLVACGLAALLALPAAVPAAPLLAAPAPAELSALLRHPDESRLVAERLDVTHWLDLTESVEPDHVPVPAAATGIGPGSKLLITQPDGSFLCTANYVWTSGGATYLGSAGHCFLPAAATATHGPGADYNPALTSVRVCVAGCYFGGELGFVFTGTMVNLGPVAYARQVDGGVRVGNDFGVVQIPSALLGQVRPSMPVWGGPVGVDTVFLLQDLCHYGQGVIYAETFATMGRTGFGLADFGDGSYGAILAGGGGDSGSPVEACDFDNLGIHGYGAVGIHTHGVGGGGVSLPLKYGTTIAKAITLAQQAGLNLALVNGV